MAVARQSDPFSGGFPAQGTPVVGDGGGVAAPWYQLLRLLYLRTGGQQGIDGATVSDEAADASLIDAMLDLSPDASAAPPPYNVTVGASPFTFQAPFNGQAAINGGNVSSNVFNRGWGLANITMPTSGLIRMAKGDQITVTYSAAPSMAWIGDPL